VVEIFRRLENGNYISSRDKLEVSNLKGYQDINEDMLDNLE
jgi:hypothetical protein